jgi:CRP/FNR family transcriptional regulator
MSQWSCMTTGFLGAIPADLNESLSKDAYQVTHPPGWVIHGRNTAARPGVVLDGLVRAYFTALDGREATILYVRPGEAIGLVGIFGAVEPTSLQAVTETTVLYFDEQRFDDLLSKEVALARAVAATLADRVLSWSQSFQSFVFSRVRARVAAHLLMLALRDEQGRLVARVTQQELANAVGSVRDVVARVLRELRHEGLIVTTRGRVVVTNEGGLERETWRL